MKNFFMISALLSFLSGSACSADRPLVPGDTVPSVTVKAHNGADFNTAEFAAKGWTLFFFFPKAFTPGCTAQSCSVRDSWAEFQKRGIRVVGISTDNVDTQAKFVSEHKFPYPLLADTEKSVIRAFGMGGFAGFSRRGAFLAKDGKIVWTDPDASTARQAEVALDAFDQLSKQHVK